MKKKNKREVKWQLVDVETETVISTLSDTFVLDMEQLKNKIVITLNSPQNELRHFFIISDETEKLVSEILNLG